MFSTNLNTMIKLAFLLFLFCWFICLCWTIKLIRGTSVFGSVFFKGQWCYWALSLICGFQSIPDQCPKGLSLSEGLQKGRGKLGERNVPSPRALQPPPQNISRMKIRKRSVSTHPGPYTCSPVSTAATSILSLLGLVSKWLWKATEGSVLTRGYESFHPQLSNSLFKLGLCPVWTENLFSSLVSKGTFLYTSSCAGVNWEQ